MMGHKRCFCGEIWLISNYYLIISVTPPLHVYPFLHVHVCIWSIGLLYLLLLSCGMGKMGIPPPKQYKNLDRSYKMDLDFWIVLEEENSSFSTIHK